MRERVEDLGRICVLVDIILKKDIWQCYEGRNKDFINFFRSLTEEKQNDLLTELIYGISNLKEDIYEISSIAEGTDRINEPS